MNMNIWIFLHCHPGTNVNRTANSCNKRVWLTNTNCGIEQCEVHRITWSLVRFNAPERCLLQQWLSPELSVQESQRIIYLNCQLCFILYFSVLRVPVNGLTHSVSNRFPHSWPQFYSLNQESVLNGKIHFELDCDPKDQSQIKS